MVKTVVAIGIQRTPAKRHRRLSFSPLGSVFSTNHRGIFKVRLEAARFARFHQRCSQHQSPGSEFRRHVRRRRVPTSGVESDWGRKVTTADRRGSTEYDVGVVAPFSSSTAARAPDHPHRYGLA